MPKNKIRAWMWSDLLIAARTEREVRALLLDRYDATDLRGSKIKPCNGKIEYCNDDGEIIGTVDGADVESVWPKPCIVPDFA
jgi:hypothetical protein